MFWILTASTGIFSTTDPPARIYTEGVRDAYRPLRGGVTDFNCEEVRSCAGSSGWLLWSQIDIRRQ